MLNTGFMYVIFLLNYLCMQRTKFLEYGQPLGRLRASAEKDVTNLKRLIEECETQNFIKQAKEVCVNCPKVYNIYSNSFNYQNCTENIRENGDSDTDITSIRKKVLGRS